MKQVVIAERNGVEIGRYTIAMDGSSIQPSATIAAAKHSMKWSGATRSAIATATYRIET